MNDAMNDPTPSGPLLTMTGMTKQYPGCLANDHVSLTVEHNQIHALLGENGAGKSTLVKIIYGVVKPDEGEIVWEGQKVVVQNPGQPSGSASAWCSSISRCSRR
jgi:ABC-type uncharacterized transport system ATPase subunit